MKENAPFLQMNQTRLIIMVGGKKKLMDDSGMGENSWKVLEIKQAIRNL